MNSDAEVAVLPLDPAVVSCWRASAGSVMTFLICTLGLICYLASAYIVVVSCLALGALVVIMTVIDLIWLIPLRARHFRYSLTGRGVEIRSGRYIQRRLLIPYHQVLYTNVRRGPFLRRYGLESLQIGTLGERFTVPGLRPQAVQNIEDALVRVSAGHHVATE